MEIEEDWFEGREGFCMARCDVTERIDTAPSRIWAWFKPEKMKQWYGPEIQVISPGPLDKGSRIRLTGRSGPKTFGYEAEVTEYIENRCMAWEGADDRASYRITLTLAPKNGYTVISLRDEFSVGGLVGWMVERFFMAKRVTKYDRYFLSKLKALAEKK